jgi:hypothetical protein
MWHVQLLERVESKSIAEQISQKASSTTTGVISSESELEPESVIQSSESWLLADVSEYRSKLSVSWEIVPMGPIRCEAISQAMVFRAVFVLTIWECIRIR